MWFLDWLLGLSVCFLFFRLGMPTIVWGMVALSLVASPPSWPFLMGLISVGLIESAYPSRDSFSWDSLLVGFFVACFSLFLLSFFSFDFSFLDRLIFPAIVFLVVSILFFSPFPVRTLVPGMALVLSLGWWGLHEWAIPLALPSILLGLFSREGALPPEEVRVSSSFMGACAGVILGLLPALGPGLVGLVWFRARSSPALLVSNLVFSVGMVALSGHVRSALASPLSGMFLPDWVVLLAWLIVGCVLAWSARSFFPDREGQFPSFVWRACSIIVLFLAGGWLSLALFGLAACVQRILHDGHVPPSLGLLVLVPPLAWFYA